MDWIGLEGDTSGRQGHRGMGGGDFSEAGGRASNFKFSVSVSFLLGSLTAFD